MAMRRSCGKGGRVPALLTAVLDLIFAPACLGCDGPIHAGDPARGICRGCHARLPAVPAPLCGRCGMPLLLTGRAPDASCQDCRHWPPALRAARSAFLLEPPADRIVHRLKYRGWRSLAGPMAERMARVLLPPDVAAEARCLVPVPTTRDRIRQRGYDQAALLAHELASRSRRSVLPLLERTRATPSQTGLQPAARAANVAGTFRVRPGAASRLRGAHLLLVDDVLTTGATAAECARTLVAAGARCASVITFARAAPQRRPAT
jgi:ComF family protein